MKLLGFCVFRKLHGMVSGILLQHCPCEDLRHWEVLPIIIRYLGPYSLRLMVGAPYFTTLGKERTVFLCCCLDCISPASVHESDHMYTVFSRNLQMLHTHIQRHIKEMPVNLHCLWVLCQQLRHVRTILQASHEALWNNATSPTHRTKVNMPYIFKKPRMYHQVKISYHKMYSENDLPNPQRTTCWENHWRNMG